MNYTSFFNNTTNANTLLGFVADANNATSGWLIWGFVGVMGVALFFAAIPYGKSKAAAFSSFVTAIVVVLLDNTGLLGASAFWVVVVLILVFAGAILQLMMAKR